MANYLYEPDHIAAARRALRRAAARSRRRARSGSCSPSRFRAVEKLVYLVWDRPSRDRRRPPRSSSSTTRAAHCSLRRRAGSQMRPRRRRRAGADDGPGSRRRAPGARAASRSGSTRTTSARQYEAILAEAGIRRAGYLVTESLYRDYGDNEHAPPRDWPDGERSPGIVMLTIFDKPAGIDDETFYGHWYGHQSPMSEWMQPRVPLRAQRGRARAHAGRAALPGDRRGGVADAPSTSPTSRRSSARPTAPSSASASASCSTAPSCSTTPRRCATTR